MGSAVFFVGISQKNLVENPGFPLTAERKFTII